MADPMAKLLSGGCACQRLRYRLQTSPMFTHACHCRWCQRETGSAFALNAMIETDRIILLAEQPEEVPVPSASGRGQIICRCPGCRVAVWSHYAAAGPVIAFLRVGTLDTPDDVPPQAHIYTESRQPWFALPPETPAFPAFYSRERLWPKTSLARLRALDPKIQAWRAQSA